LFWRLSSGSRLYGLAVVGSAGDAVGIGAGIVLLDVDVDVGTMNVRRGAVDGVDVLIMGGRGLRGVDGVVPVEDGAVDALLVDLRPSMSMMRLHSLPLAKPAPPHPLPFTCGPLRGLFGLGRWVI
jgi:hypothetical protein